jgi:hypothetical protein
MQLLAKPRAMAIGLEIQGASFLDQEALMLRRSLLKSFAEK